MNNDINWELEEKIYKLIMMIHSNPGPLIGEKNIHRLSTFISGYMFALFELTGYFCHFDRDFQKYIENRMGTGLSIHWDEIISNGCTKEEAFELFYDCFQDFYSVPKSKQRKV